MCDAILSAGGTLYIIFKDINGSLGHLLAFSKSFVVVVYILHLLVLQLWSNHSDLCDPL